MNIDYLKSNLILVSYLKIVGVVFDFVYGFKELFINKNVNVKKKC